MTWAFKIRVGKNAPSFFSRPQHLRRSGLRLKIFTYLNTAPSFFFRPHSHSLTTPRMTKDKGKRKLEVSNPPPRKQLKQNTQPTSNRSAIDSSNSILIDDPSGFSGGSPSGSRLRSSDSRLRTSSDFTESSSEYHVDKPVSPLTTQSVGNFKIPPLQSIAENKRVVFLYNAVVNLSNAVAKLSAIIPSSQQSNQQSEIANLLRLTVSVAFCNSFQVPRFMAR